MQQINIRQLRRDVKHGADGRLIFPGMTEITDGVITSGGKLTYVDNGVDVQSQIDTVVAAVAAIDIHAHVQDNVCYVDSKRTDSYTQDGSESLPYKTLSAAITAKLTNAATAFISFRLASGTYDGTISVDKDSANQSFEIVGSGRTSTFIRGAATFVNTTGNVLYFRDFNDITIKDLSISNGQYGFYPRSCRNIKLFNVEFVNLGSDGEEKHHDQSESQSSQAAFWASSSTSNGGTCRIRDCQDVRISRCRTSYSLRGFRIQDCASGAITNCRAYKLLESAYYLAAGDYTGNTGSSNFYISGCVADSIFHSGVLIIGGRNNTVQGVSCVNCASSPFNTFHAADVRIVGCTADKCNTLSYIGIGVPGDNYGQIYKAGKTNVLNTGGYELVAVNNVFSQCGIGRAQSGDSTAFYFTDNGGLASSRVIIDGNHSDATTALYNPDSIPLVLGQYPEPPGGDISQAEFDTLESTVNGNTTDIGTNTTSLATKLGMSNNAVTITHNQGADTSIYLKRGGDSKQLAITRKSSYTKWKTIGGGSEHFIMFDDGRFDFKTGITRLASISTTPSESAGNAKGGFWYDSTNALLKWHDGSSWRTVAFV